MDSKSHHSKKDSQEESERSSSSDENSDSESEGGESEILDSENSSQLSARMKEEARGKPRELMAICKGQAMLERTIKRE